MKNKRLILSISIISCAIATLFALKVSIRNKNGFEGIFLLKGVNGAWLEVTDDLFPEEVRRLIWGRPGTWFKKTFSFGLCQPPETPCLSLEWNEAEGRGFIKTSYPDGTKLLICLGRYIDSETNLPARGLFLGGNLPPTDPDSQIFNKDESGMAFFDGARYYHIWCNVNESIYLPSLSMQPLYPSTWQYGGSRILECSKNGVTLQSRHRVISRSISFDIVKTFFYSTGNSYFTLVTEITNTGNGPAPFIYSYGDEPWIGNFGSSAGDIGWLKGRLVFDELLIDTTANSYAGMFDHGNPRIGEQHRNYTGKANFIEWERNNKPEMAFFSNTGGIPLFSGKPPLDSEGTRYIGLRWGPRTLAPGQSFNFALAIGMAEMHPGSDLPAKPATGLN